MSRATEIPRINEEYIKQVSKDIDRRKSESVTQESCRTENWILGAIWNFDESLPNSQVVVQSGTVTGPDWDINGKNQEEDDYHSENDLLPEFKAEVRNSFHKLVPDSKRVLLMVKSAHK